MVSRYREVAAISVRYRELFYETLTMIPSVLIKSVRYKEVSTIKHVRYKEVPLYNGYEWNSLQYLLIKCSEFRLKTITRVGFNQYLLTKFK